MVTDLRKEIVDCADPYDRALNDRYLVEVMGWTFLNTDDPRANWVWIDPCGQQWSPLVPKPRPLADAGLWLNEGGVLDRQRLRLLSLEDDDESERVAMLYALRPPYVPIYVGRHHSNDIIALALAYADYVERKAEGVE